ncbi:MAG: hypothetical protein K9L68_04500 [Spirochaetales bacterium]|nr:hypothetical protein [Spirochaetales bacterium]MCF7937838.1 hypothetical protein [Spirochaetales bacterium]
MKLIIFHYHLLPGGVTGVIRNSVPAILRHIPEIEQVTLVCGREENSQTVLENIRRELSPADRKRVDCSIFPEIDYQPAADKTEARSRQRVLRDKLLTGFGKGRPVWWVHNYHLGKNPVFTGALIEIAHNHSEIGMVFHIHDFPESARYDNLRLLRRISFEASLYPDGENIRYVTINSRDCRLLKSSGIREDHVYQLDNPVPGLQRPTGETTEHTEPVSSRPREAIERHSSGRFPGYRRGAPHFLYPVRCIRRKNVLETAALIKLLPEEPNLIVTLPGVSERERRYSEFVERLFCDGVIPGIFGIGAQSDISLDELGNFSDAVVSSSVQEGFGYLFIQALGWKKPLIARRIDILDDFAGVFKGRGVHLYPRFLVPADRQLAATTREAYESKIAGLSDILPEESLDQLHSEIAKLGADGTIDLSLLSVERQSEILRLIDEQNYRNTCREMNQSLMEIEHSGNQEEQSDLLRFSPVYHAEKTGEILASLTRREIDPAGGPGKPIGPGEPDGPSEPGSLPSPGVPAAPERTERYILHFFAHLENIRLLYDF